MNDLAISPEYFNTYQDVSTGVFEPEPLSVPSGTQFKASKRQDKIEVIVYDASPIMSNAGIYIPSQLPSTSFYQNELSQATHIFEEVQELLSDYSEEDWDGYGAKSINQESVANGINFLNSIPQFSSFAQLFAHTNGNFCVRFANRYQSVSVTIDSNNKVSYAALSDDEETMSSFQFKGRATRQLLKIISESI